MEKRLEEVVLDILARNKHGLNTRQLVQHVSDSGWLTTEVQNCLSKLIERAAVDKDLDLFLSKKLGQ
jgi:hypothetical protein